MQKLLPMLAVPSAPFDSPDHVFEVKWDGIRALASAGPGWCLWGRNRVEYSARYPEMEVLRRLPEGLVLDGELIRFTPAGQPNFRQLLARHQITETHRAQQACRFHPVTYVVFDLLVDRGRSLLGQPLQERRARLQELLTRFREPRWQFSDGIVGAGKVFFEAAVQQGQEGVMAKHLASRYQPGRRTAAWRKIKPRRAARRTIVG